MVINMVKYLLWLVTLLFLSIFLVSDAKNTTEKKKESKEAKDGEEKETVTVDDSLDKAGGVPPEGEESDSSAKELPNPSKTGM